MTTAPRRWQVFDEGLPVLTCEYSFGPGTARTLAFRGSEGFVVLSPAGGDAAAAMEDLARQGDVRALVAPNAYHTMGLAAWKARFPGADLFAPAQSIARVERRTGLAGIRPVRELAALTGPRVRVDDMPFYKTGEALVRLDTARGLAWYVTDIVFNFRELPKHPVPRLAFRLAGSAPGLRFNNIAPLFMVADKRKLRQWFVGEAIATKPRWLIPSHGEIIDLEAHRDEAARLFRPV